MKYKILTFLLNHSLSINRFIFNLFFAWLPVDENKIVVNNQTGNSYGCNPKYIIEELIKQNCKFKIIWLANPEVDKNDFDKNIKLVKFKSLRALYELATAKVWLDNNRKGYHLRKGLGKKEKQIYIQTWHGSLGIKRIDMDVKAFTCQKSWCSLVKYEGTLFDYLITNSEFENKILPYAFDCEPSKIACCGHPRNDIFFYPKSRQEEIKDKIRNKYNIEKNDKILLYAPSFRDNLRLDCYNIELENIRKSLEEKTNESWKVLIRLHPRLSDCANRVFKFNDTLIDASAYCDIQEILLLSDIVISDYSSCMFDFMLTRRPCFIYAEDIERYNDERGFYYPLEATPFPVATNNEELKRNILNFDNEKYVKEVDKFLEEKGCIDDGNASKKVVEIIKNKEGQ